jgi:hypothetical protein
MLPVNITTFEHNTEILSKGPIERNRVLFCCVQSVSALRSFV